jgi:hypothetical protein
MAVLWRAALSGDIGDEMTIGFLNSQLEVILKHFMTYFPYGSDSLGRREQKVCSVNDLSKSKVLVPLLTLVID